MKIAVTAEWIGASAGGPERYVKNLITELADVDTNNDYQILVSHEVPQVWKESLGKRMHFKHVGRSRWYAVPVGTPLKLLGSQIDLLHATYVAPPLCSKPFVLTVHDLGFEIHPEFFPPLVRHRLALLTRHGVRRAASIIAVSEETKQTLIDCYNVAAERITVTPNGVEAPFFEPADKHDAPIRSSYTLPADYILYVGKLQARKNIARLLRAYHLLRQSRDDTPELVLVGQRTWLANEIYSVLDELKLHNVVRFTGHVPDEHLPAIYRGASVFVYPSLFEGFGIPLLEAMACRVPVTCSNLSSLPEVVGDAALQFDPLDIDDIADKLAKVLNDSALRHSLITCGRKRAEQYLWKNTAEKTLQVYRNTANMLGMHNCDE